MEVRFGVAMPASAIGREGGTHPDRRRAAWTRTLWPVQTPCAPVGASCVVENAIGGNKSCSGSSVS